MITNSTTLNEKQQSRPSTVDIGYVSILSRLPTGLQNIVLSFVPNHYQSMKQGLLKEVELYQINILRTHYESNVHSLDVHMVDEYKQEKKEGLIPSWIPPNETQNICGCLKVSYIIMNKGLAISKKLRDANYNTKMYILIGSKKLLKTEMKKFNQFCRQFDNRLHAEIWKNYYTFTYRCPWYDKLYYCKYY